MLSFLKGAGIASLVIDILLAIAFMSEKIAEMFVSVTQSSILSGMLTERVINFIIATFLVLILVTLFIYKRYYSKKKGNTANGISIVFIFIGILGILLGPRLANITCAKSIFSQCGGGVLACTLIYVSLRIIIKGLLKASHFLKNSNGKMRQAVCFFIVVMVVSNICVALYAFSCKYIYYWDNAIYWTYARDIASGSISNDFFHELYNSILTFDYNYLASLFPALAAYAFGNSRAVYIFAIVNFYFVPCVMVVYLMSRSILKTSITILFLPILLFLSLTGFVDVVGFAVCVICYILYEYIKKSNAKWEYSVLLGFMLVLLILIRRWYAFFAVSFIIATLVDCFIEFAIKMTRNKKSAIKFWANGLINTIIAAFTVANVMLLFFSPLVMDKLLVDYSAVYAGYKFSIETDVRLFARYFGVIPTLLIFIGTVYCCVKRDRRCIAAILQAAICFILFIRTQTHGQQHLLLYAPAFAVITVYSLSNIPAKTKTTLPVIICTLIGAFVISANTLVDRVQPQSLSEINHIALLPDFSMRPRVRDDVYDILKLKKMLDDKYSDGMIGVNASSFVLNADILNNVQPSLGESEPDRKYIKELPAVDSRDKDMSRVYDIDYILTASPVQTHLGEGKQSVVVKIDEQLRNETTFGAAYECVEDDYNVTNFSISIFKRTREVTEDEKQAFEKIISQ